MKKISLNIFSKLKSRLYYYFRCFKPKINPNLSDYSGDYVDDNVEDYVEDNTDSERVTLIHLYNK